MAREKEVKILEVDVADLEQTIIGLGAKLHFDGMLTTVYYEPSDGSRTDYVLRLRWSDRRARITYKDDIQKGAIKDVEELETTVGDIPIMREMLKKLGYVEYKCTEKHRRSYHLGNIHFDFDTYDGIPTFLEIEAPTKKEIKKYVATLGFTMKDALSWSTKELFAHYKIK